MHNRTINQSIRRDANGLFICPFCNNPFKALVYHTRQVHNINKKQLRIMFNLPLNYSLEVDEVRENRRNKALLYNMDENLKEWGKNNRFKKGKFNKEMVEAISRGHIKKGGNTLNKKIIGKS